METFKKNWLSYLGVMFVFTAFIYFLKHAIDQHWLPPVVRVALGLTVGITGMFVGLHFHKKQKGWIAQVLAGFGLAVSYATISYASLSEEVLWSSNTLFVVMVTLTGIVTWLSYSYELRILSFLSILGGLITPLFLQAHESQVWLLFFFVFLLNGVSLYLSATKKWVELRVMSFLATLLVYVTYYVLFDPVNWRQPFLYISSFFVVYMAGLFMASWFNERDFEGVNMYLGLLNAINYVLWSVFILSNFEMSYAYPTIITGVIFISMAVAMFYASGKKMLAPGIFFVLGVVVIAIAGGDLGIHYATKGMRNVVLTAVWMGLISGVYFMSKLVGISKLKNGSIIAMTGLMLNWFIHAWEVEWVSWFGVKFIPFINPGALVWMAFAAIGFYLSKTFLNEKDKQSNLLSRIAALVSHLVVGGLLTIQLINLWDAYNLAFFNLTLSISIVWMIYAVLIFVWGVFSKDVIYKSFASFVVVTTSLKVFFYDLHGSGSIEKVILLLIVGGLTFFMAFLNKKIEDKLVNDESNDLLEADTLSEDQGI